VVEEHGAQPAALEIQVRLLHPLVEHRLHAGRGAQQVERERALERAHAFAPEIAEAAHRPVVAPHHERLGKGVVRPREGDARPARRRHLDAVEGHVEVAALERGDQRLPVVLHELGAHAEAARERVGDLDLEAREPAPVARVLEDVGLAALTWHLKDDIYRFPPPKDPTGHDLYQLALHRLENWEKRYPGRLRDVTGYARAEALEHLGEYRTAAGLYRQVAALPSPLAEH